jgi:serine/tyrosine/threonine adenylyltransferase
VNAQSVITATASPIVPLTGGWRLEHSYARLPAGFFTSVSPTPVSSPRLVLLNRPLAEELGLDPAVLAQSENAAWFTGNVLPPGAFPIAQAYAGHQYGNFVRLGDGRAILLGEQITPRGERFDIQLKGPGPTPYSRRGDGRAALGPMLREYIISEAMHALNIPTTRSLAVAATGEPVFRETTLHGAILTRIAASHLRVGTVEWVASTGEIKNLRALADYTLQRHYPALTNVEQPYVALLKAVLERQAALIARWQHVGFVHGVMNTDNMALSGETIDYGPCAFMDAYHPATVFSSIDHHGRYAYANQPKIAHWNISCLASAMLPLLDTNEEEAVAVANSVLQTFPKIFRTHWLVGQRAKLGLFNEEPGDAELAESLLAVMQKQGADFTNTFRDLSGEVMTHIELAAHAEFRAWHTRWQERLGRQPQNRTEACALMRQHNPAFIPRNHKVEEALSAATFHGDLSEVEKLLDVIAQPFAYDRQLPDFSTPPAPDAPVYQTFCGT